jgi:hypothetical protein
MAKKPDNGILNLFFRGFDPQIDVAENMILLENKIKHIPPTMMVQEEYTPQLAEAILRAKNKGNRNINSAVIVDYTRHMTNGTFRFSPASVIFTVTGALADGQHRLLSIVRSGVTLSMFTLYNAPPEIFEDVDRGKRRSLYDDLVVLREPKAQDMAKAIPQLYYVREPTIGSPRSAWKLSVQLQREYWKHTLDKSLMRQCIEDGYIVEKDTTRTIIESDGEKVEHTYFPFNVIAAVLYRIHRIETNEVADFMEAYLRPYSGFVQIAQDRMDALRNTRKGAGGGLQMERIRLLAEAWNLYRVKLHPELEQEAILASNGNGPDFI